MRALHEGRDPRPRSRGRSGVWVPGHDLPPLRDFIGAQPSEEVIGVRIVTECRLRARTPAYALLDRLFHVPNGGKRGRVEAALLRAQGVRPGVPDYSLPVPSGGYHGLMFELKKHDGQLSGEQRAEITRLYGDGYLAACVWGWADAIDLMLWYLDGARGWIPGVPVPAPATAET